MNTALKGIISHTLASSKSLAEEADIVAEATRQIRATAEHHAQSSSATAAAVEQMSASIDEVAQLSDQSRVNSSVTATLADVGTQMVSEVSATSARVASATSETLTQMEQLVTRSKEIGNIADTIREIADQTNLLALNAAIEAARAGEQGRGFAVVADEVRKLAERTSGATGEIAGMVEHIQGDSEAAARAMSGVRDEVARGQEQSADVSRQLAEIAAKARESLANAEQVANATREQSATMQEIAKNMEQVTVLSDETDQATSRNAEAVSALRAQAAKLREDVGFFRT